MSYCRSALSAVKLRKWSGHSGSSDDMQGKASSNLQFARKQCRMTLRRVARGHQVMSLGG